MSVLLFFACSCNLVGIYASPFEAAVSGGYNVIHNLWPRVDATSCRTMTYQVKTCQDHGFSLLDKDGVELVEYLIGGWYNGRSRLIIRPTNQHQEISTPSIFKCGEYRWFWMSWGDGAVRYGKGSVIGENIILDKTDSTGQDVKRLGLKAIGNSPTSIQVGETERGRFELMSTSGKLDNGLIEEVSANLSTCSMRCTEHTDCGIFSYNEDRGMCTIHDRMVSTFSVTQMSGWKSWRMLYCYP